MPWVHSKLLNERLSKTLSYNLPTEKYREVVLPGTRALIQLEIFSKLPWMVTLQCPTNPILFLDVICHYVNATHTEWQKSILILLFWGTFGVKITCEVICLMQFPTNSLVSQCINTMRLILMTRTKSGRTGNRPAFHGANLPRWGLITGQNQGHMNVSSWART